MAHFDELMSSSAEIFHISKNTSIKNERGSKLMQFVAAIAVSINVIASGVMLCWTSPILMMLQENPVNKENPLGRPISNEEVSWVGGLATAGSVISCLIPGYLADKWGRRVALLISVAPAVLSWVLVFLANRIEFLYASRLISGLAVSFTFGLISIYVGEIAEPSVRGILGSFLQIFLNLGLMIPFGIGPFVSYNNYRIICATLPIVFFIVFFAMPETPYYLAAKGRKEDVIKVLVRLRGKSREAVEEEAHEIQTAVQEAYSKKSTIMDLFKVKVNLKAIIICCSLIFIQQLSGITALLVYLPIIFASCGTFSITPIYQTIIITLVQLIGSCFNPLVIDRLGRKILLVISGIGSSLSLGVLGLFFFLKDVVQTDVSNIGWLPISSLIVFMATYSVGLGPVPWTVVGEILPQEMKSKASTIIIFLSCFMSFIVIKYFVNIVDAFGQYTAFWFFGFFCFLSVPFGAFILPETKNKSLQKIQDELHGKKS
ncbi:facilitated trehalose transporter Tret1-like [Cotesia glomerata]|uniref:facilitated trehalose transporter Tret1-like n=1 Tax=Cotesia glomerata TaxID=32391 RepID=UPI001D026FC3|nr:facilitated trehalose transporter Tret1-like [Cotesia glomerata]